MQQQRPNAAKNKNKINFFKKLVLRFAATRMQLAIIILSEISQKEKDKYHLKKKAIYLKSTTASPNNQLGRLQGWRT